MLQIFSFSIFKKMPINKLFQDTQLQYFIEQKNNQLKIFDLWRKRSILTPKIIHLAGNSKKAAFDKKTMKLIYDIEDLESSIKDKLIYLANAIIRDAKNGKAYAS